MPERAGLISQILPPEVAAAEEFGDPDDAMLFPEEQAAVAKAVEKRRREFTTGRACARAALAKLGVGPAPILRGPRGCPQWPPGIVGSVTHCEGYRASAVARTSDVITLGLDAEPHDRISDGVLRMVASEGERAMLAGLLAAVPEVCWDKLLFSAKESVYKAWFPLARRWLGFTEATISFDPERESFAARLLAEGPVCNGSPLTGFEGRWLVRDGLILTAIVVPA